MEVNKCQVRERIATRIIKHLADSLEAYNGGSIGRLTTSNAEFDAKFNNRYAEPIASVKEREGSGIVGLRRRW